MLNGSQIVAETWTQNGIEYMLRYIYDESGAPIGMKYRTSQQAAEYYTLYFFEKNAFGDIIGIYGSGGDLLGTYTYDAWGNCTVSGTDAVLQMNPFRYRGYYYDAETGFYYLQSRYYNPAWGRFLNADANPGAYTWERTKDSLLREWSIHNFAYAIFFKRDRTADCDFDNADEGKYLFDYISEHLFKLGGK